MSFSCPLYVSLVALLFYLSLFLLTLFLPFVSVDHILSLISQFSPSFAAFVTMEAAMPAGPVDPLGFEKVHASMYHVEPIALPSSPVCTAASSAALKQPQAYTLDPLPALGVPQETNQEEECLVDSQPICFSENPFLVANRKGKGCPPEERILSGPPVGYGRHGQLQPWLYSKASSLEECVL